MSDSRGPQLHPYSDRRLSTLTRQGPRLSEVFEPRSRLSAIVQTPASGRRRSYTNSAQRASFGYVGLAIGGTPALLRRQTSLRLLPLNNPALLRTDPRNIRNRVYWELILKEVYDFCIANNFEAEMGHIILLATFEKPTQKDFVFLFKFVYGKLDPNYRFLVLFDTDMKAILKHLSYPAVDKLRDASSAAGEQNWPQNLSMLYWLVKLNLTFLNLNEEETFAASAGDSHTTVYNCIFLSYAVYIESVDNVQAQQVLENKLTNSKDAIVKAGQEKKVALLKLTEEKDLLLAESARLDEAKEMTPRLKSDIASLEKYISGLQNGYTSFTEKAGRLETQATELGDKLTALLQEKDNYNTVLQEKGIGIELLKRLQEEQKKIAKAMEVISSKLKMARLRGQSTEDSLLKAGHILLESVSHYNQTIRKIPQLAGVDDLAVNEQIVDDKSQLYTPEQILSRPLAEEREVLSRVDSQLKTERLGNDEDYIQILQHIEDFKQTLAEKESKLSLLESALARNKAAHENLQTQSDTDTQRLHAEIDKLDLELQGMKNDMRHETQKMRRTNASLKRELMETRFTVKESREHLLRTVQADLNYVISFKDHIQKKLELLQDEARKELENEQRREEAQ